MREERAREHGSSQRMEVGLSRRLTIPAPFATADCLPAGPCQREAFSDQTLFLMLHLIGFNDTYLKTNGRFSRGLSSHSTEQKLKMF